MGWIIFGVSGWVVCGMLCLVDRVRRPRSTETEAQLQQTSREFAAARRHWQVELGDVVKAHQSQMDAIHGTVIAFEVDQEYTDPEAVRRLLDELRKKTTPRAPR